MRYLIRAVGWLILYAAVTLITVAVLHALNLGEEIPLSATGLIVGAVITAAIALAARMYDRRKRREGHSPSGRDA